MRMSATAAKLQEAPRFIPMPDEPLEPGKIVDTHGDTLTNHGRGSLMSRLDAKASEKIELSKGTIIAIGFLPAFLMVVFYWGGSVLGFVRSDTETKLMLQRVEQKQIATDQDIKDIKDTLHQMAIKKAEERGFTLGATATEQEKK